MPHDGGRLPRVAGELFYLAATTDWPSTQPPLPLAFSLYGWISNDHRDRFIALDAVGIATGLRNGAWDEAGDVALFIVRVAEGIGDEHAQLLGGGRPRQVEDLREDAKLCNGERSELHLEGDDAL